MFPPIPFAGQMAGLAGLLRSAPFFAPLTHSLILTRGTGDPTYTRATTAYVENNDGFQVQAISGEARFEGARRIRNLITGSSEDLTNAAWTKSNCTAAVSVAVSPPTGYSTVTKLTCTGGLATHHALQVTAFTLGGTAYFGVVAKAAELSWMLLRGQGTPDSFVYFNLATGAVGTTAGAGVSGSTVDLGDGWYLCLLKNTYTAWTQCSVFVTNADNVNNISSDNNGIYVTGLRFEDVTAQTTQTAGEYVSVGVLSAPFHGAGVDGVKYFATDIAGSAIASATNLGYLAEGARTNLFIQSNDFTNVAWVKATMTTAKTSTGPDGVANSATRLTASGALATVLQLLVAAASDRTWSVWARRVTGTGTIKLFQGATKTADLASSLNSVTYTRIELDATVDVTLLGCGIEIGTDTDAIDVWCGQFEAGAFASSPIPTTTVAVTRNADVLTYPSAGNISDTAGWAYAEAAYAVGGSPSNARILGDGTNGASTPLTGTSSISTVSFDGVTAVSTGDGGTASSTNKFGSTWGSTQNAVINGGAVASGTYDGAYGLSSIGIGYGGSSPWSGTIKNVRIGRRQLSNSELQAVTT